MARNRVRKGRALDGWLVIDKPSGVTSTAVVSILKRAFNAQKVGHGGTLDPLATGLLPIAMGAATKTVPYIMDGTKKYHFTLKLGEARDSDDADGNVTAVSDVRPSDEQLRKAAAALTGDIMQVPPVFSALKVAGERAYDMAREGRPPELPPRPARVDRFELIDRPDADHAIFEVESGKGVYMRSLARDVALACGAVGHIATLRRLRVGPFFESDAISLDKIVASAEEGPVSPELLRPVSTALADIPAVALMPDEAALIRHGQALGLMDFVDRLPETGPDDVVRLMDGETVLGLGRSEEGWLRPVRLL